ncbi:MAG: TIGR02680 family protein, partial [Acidimicrobiales bacterium]
MTPTTDLLDPPAPAPPGPGAALPRPRRSRWQPLRGGLVNLYRYDHEEFRYTDGHLLLRGNNGTGKSRVLALQLPFLLDGEVASHRLEPDGDGAKRMEWNLLLGRYSDRLGYTWLELGRHDEDGTDHFLTLGCGLRAVEGRGLVDRWFFLTDRRVGHDLFLQAPSGQTLTRDRLVEALGGRGEVHATAASYRAAVDRSLFRLGEHRYAALVNLLIQLRQPQLSRQLQEARLSAALSEALPPPSPAVIGDVAESFRSLEADRLALEAFESAGRGTDAFLAEYRRYVQVAARRRAHGVTSAHAAYEAAMRRLRAAESDREEAAADLARVSDDLERLAGDERAAQAAVDTLADSPQMRDARALDRARREADARRHEVERAGAELDRAAE